MCVVVARGDKDAPVGIDVGSVEDPVEAEQPQFGIPLVFLTRVLGPVS